LKELSIIGVEYDPAEISKIFAVHYIKQISTLFLQIFPSGKDIVGGNKRLVSGVTNSVMSVFNNRDAAANGDEFYPTNNSAGIESNVGGLISEIVYNVFDSYSKLSGNFHHTVLRKFLNDPLVFNSFSNRTQNYSNRVSYRTPIDNEEDADQKKESLFESITKKLGRLIHTTLILPLATPI
jgi:hypothetical protein